MSKTDEIRVRVTPEEKQRADELFERCGLNMSVAVRMFLRQALAVGGLPFTMETPAPGSALPAEDPNRKQ